MNSPISLRSRSFSCRALCPSSACLISAAFSSPSVFMHPSRRITSPCCTDSTPSRNPPPPPPRLLLLLPPWPTGAADAVVTVAAPPGRPPALPPLLALLVLPPPTPPAREVDDEARGICAPPLLPPPLIRDPRNAACAAASMRSPPPPAPAGPLGRALTEPSMALLPSLQAASRFAACLLVDVLFSVYFVSADSGSSSQTNMHTYPAT